ncbi:Glycoside hydrolase [Pleurostoma richardsiae]|uniref:Glycoside hydrolase n=1 Tax=Pleurostoma richardsiae TaxID=41990 RepID=A0AA38R6H0_9PEZI|nr:Glycoside hydrolase [Pleurostoma richardsiae]
MVKLLASLLALGAGICAAAHRANWPNGPFTTSGRYVLDASGKNVTYAGANWPGAADVMIPEGLQFQSVESIVSKLKSIGMNAIRLTYAIEMIDQIYENGGEDIPIKTAFLEGLGAENGTKVFNQVLDKNPGFNPNITRLQVFDAVVAECAKQHIYVHLDNHISKGMWCCDTEDGNSWWGDTYFSVANWTRGLAYMADHGKAWPNLMSMSLRNEPREPQNNATLDAETYNWEYWYKYIKQGTDAINGANPDVLIFLSGLGFDTYLTPVVQGTALTPGNSTFSRTDFPGYADKLVLDLHNYQTTSTNCTSLQKDLYNDGFQALTPAAANMFPVMLTEFGLAMDNTSWHAVYPTCLASYLPAQKAGWFIWVLAGSYYIRHGVQDSDETWGLLTHDWSTWRSPSYIDGALIGMVNRTLA